MSFTKSWRFIYTRYKEPKLLRKYCKNLKKINKYKEGNSLVLKSYPRYYNLSRWLNSSIKISLNLLRVLWK